MHEALQPPSLKKIEAPKPLNLQSADQPLRKKGQRVEFGEDMIKAMGLLDAKTKLEARIAELQDLADLSPDAESRSPLEQEIKDLEDNREGILQNLAELRPEDFATEAAFEKMLKNPASKEMKTVIETKENEKNDLEEDVDKLKAKLRVARAELKEVVGKNKARSGELEAQIREQEQALASADAKRLEAWKALKELDANTYGADADLELALASQESRNLKKATDQEIEDVLAGLHEQIEKS